MLGVKLGLDLSLYLIHFIYIIHSEAYNLIHAKRIVNFQFARSNGHSTGAYYRPDSTQCSRTVPLRHIGAFATSCSTMSKDMSNLQLQNFMEDLNEAQFEAKNTMDESNIDTPKGLNTDAASKSSTPLENKHKDQMEDNTNNAISHTIVSVSEQEESDREALGVPSSQALTNIVMTVEYDGGEYSGFVGPNHFYNQERQELAQTQNCPKSNTKREVLPKSVSNELLRAIVSIHGYLPLRKNKGTEKSKQNDGDDDDDDIDLDAHETYELPPERRFTLIASSRTDKGVHATETACQYLSFDKEPPFGGDTDFIMDKVNRILPEDIRITAMIAAPSPDFNVRYDNLGKCYTYKVDLSEWPNIFERKYYWQITADKQFRNTLLKKYSDIRKEFCFVRMRKAADAIEGTHNFEGFRKKSRGNEKAINKNPVCTIERIDFERYTDSKYTKFNVVITGDRFLYKMVRGIVSHIVMVGYDILKVEDIKNMLENAEPIPDIPYAPSTGLYLTKVIFEPEVDRALAASKERGKRRLRELLKCHDTTLDCM
ncbi:tRNA pseudouridine synthase A [Babesia sp. Xinjiang]|uniref:tRNA pseudouridine synthase A n=1 Tax=Babesia sp. Xinjiang TaxID=462227 RepID=UPI000A22333F|nr:tRNA pseudouridine synthase A [Babesia sp. Xinjiang]ORM40650.1 tRNA pseudouridine synthase A [Babesia sp. Xinjiang]